MADKGRSEFFPHVPRADAEYTRRLGNLFGATTAFGRSIRTIMRLGGMREKSEEKPSEVAPAEQVDRTEAETFLHQADAIKAQYAETHREPEQALQEYEQLIAQARSQLERQEGLVQTLVSLYRQLKRARDTARSTEARNALTTVLQKVPAVVRSAAQPSQGAQGQRQQGAAEQRRAA